MTELQPSFTVSELNTYVNTILGLDENLNSITVRGEISGFKRHASGHLYFSLKDENASVRVVMFKYSAMRLSFLPKDGLSVSISGHVGLYEKDGSFQLYAESMSTTGAGDLYKRFIALKDELEKKGWFSADIKKSIPFLPSSVGVVTSASGAAIEDIRKVIGRRFPSMPIILYPASVQGNGAAEEIAAAIEKADAANEVDVLIVGRGGGSLEDLWAFNELPVAVAIHNCSLPVISAVGHEIDFSICDFVSDVRAATPSAAAEIAVPEYRMLQDSIATISSRLEKCVQRGLSEKNAYLKMVSNSVIFRNPCTLLESSSQRLETGWNTLSELIARRLSDYSLRLKVAYAGIRAYSEESLLKKGYISAIRDDGTRIFSIDELETGERILLRFKDGSAHVSVLDTYKEV